MCRLFAITISILSLAICHAAPGNDRPKLVVGIVVDQLQTDYLDYLRPMMSKGGFNRLLGNGLYITDLDFGVPHTDAASATAQLYTGSWPANTGVAAATVFDRNTRRMIPVLLDGKSYSPQRLSLSTVTDELVIDGQRFGKVYSLAIDPQTAVLMGGHSPTSTAWIDPATGQWATSSYYNTMLPAPLAKRNVRKPLRSRLDTMRWEPLLNVKDYPGLPPQKKYQPFSHRLHSSSRDAYSLFGATPPGNREVTDVAIEYLNELKPGHGNGTIDMLNLGYSLAPFTATRDGDYRIELLDSYLRLDLDLERLLNALDKSVGLDNTLIFLVSTGHFDNDAQPSSVYRIPGGEVSTKRAEALLNSYLSAKYGHADYIDGIAGTHVYFNPNALEAAMRRIAPGGETPLQAARDFLTRMDGISSAATVSDILGGTTESLEEAKRAIDTQNAGELIMEIQPGWVLVDDNATPVVRRVIRRSAVATPAIILSPSLAPGKISEPVSALRIAPTLSRLLHLPSPNGALGRSLPVNTR